MSDVKVKDIEEELHELYQEIEEGRNMKIAKRAVHIASVLLAKVKRQKTMLQKYQQIKGLPSAQPELIEKAAYIRGFEQGRTQGMIDAQGGKK